MVKNNLAEQQVSIRVKLTGLWLAMLLTFAYVDIFSLFRKDTLENALNSKVFSFHADQTFFTITTVYVLIPIIVMILTLFLRARFVRILNVIVATIYILTIVGSMIGENWVYYLLGSLVEIILLAFAIKISFAWSYQSEA